MKGKLDADLKKFHGLLGKVLNNDEAARRAIQAGEETRILDIACGEAVEAETLSDFFAGLKNETQNSKVKLTGIDVRAREISNAQLRFGKTKADREFEFFTGDATKLDGHRELGEDFDVVFMRHQNYWNGERTWDEIFDQALKKLGPDGRLVITSYFDDEHTLALDAIQRLGGKLIVTDQNCDSRELPTDGKSIDRHIAVFERDE